MDRRPYSKRKISRRRAAWNHDCASQKHQRKCGAHALTPKSASKYWPLCVIMVNFTLTTADSDDLARVYRFDLAQDSEMISPTIPI